MSVPSASGVNGLGMLGNGGGRVARWQISRLQNATPQAEIVVAESPSPPPSPVVHPPNVTVVVQPPAAPGVEAGAQTQLRMSFWRIICLVSVAVAAAVALGVALTFALTEDSSSTTTV